MALSMPLYCILGIIRNVLILLCLGITTTILPLCMRQRLCHSLASCRLIYGCCLTSTCHLDTLHLHRRQQAHTPQVLCQRHSILGFRSALTEAITDCNETSSHINPRLRRFAPHLGLTMWHLFEVRVDSKEDRDSTV